MPSPSDFPTPGKVTAVLDGSVIFAPRGTSYELHLKAAGPYSGPTNTPVEAIIRVQARKVWTVPSGGNFITPIMGPPKIIQGWVKHLDERQLVVHAGASFIVDLPSADSALDLANGAIAVGTMVKLTPLPHNVFSPWTAPAHHR